MIKKQEEYLKKIIDKRKGISYYKYYLDPNIEESYIDEINKSIVVKGRESTNPGCRIKTYEAFRMINDKEFDYIIRINESTLVDLILLDNILEKFKPKFAGMINTIHKNQIDPVFGIFDNRYKGVKYMSGRCIILSKDSINFLNNYDKSNIDDIIDDLSIGILMVNYTTKWLNLRNYFRLIPFNCKNNGIIFMHKTENRNKDIENFNNTSKFILKKYKLI